MGRVRGAGWGARGVNLTRKKIGLAILVVMSLVAVVITAYALTVNTARNQVQRWAEDLSRRPVDVQYDGTYLSRESGIIVAFKIDGAPRTVSGALWRLIPWGEIDLIK